MSWDKIELATGTVVERGVTLPPSIAAWAHKGTAALPMIANPAAALAPDATQLAEAARQSVAARAGEIEQMSAANARVQALIAEAEAEIAQLQHYLAADDPARPPEAVALAQDALDNAQRRLARYAALPVMTPRPALDFDAELARLAKQTWVPDELVGFGWVPAGTAEG